MGKSIPHIFYLFLFLSFSLSSMEDRDSSLPKESRFILEYGRGINSLTSSYISLNTDDTVLHFHNVELSSSRYSWWKANTLLFEILGGEDTSRILYALLEPYQSIRMHFFLKKNTSVGLGFAIEHFKVVLKNTSQVVLVDGEYEGASINRYTPINSFIKAFDFAGGINHITISALYRMKIRRTIEIPDGIIQPYFGGRLGLALPYLETVYQSGEYVYENQSISPLNIGASLNAGARFKFAKHFGLYSEYQSAFSLLTFMPFTNNEEGFYRAFFITHHFQAGLSLFF